MIIDLRYKLHRVELLYTLYYLDTITYLFKTVQYIHFFSTIFFLKICGLIEIFFFKYCFPILIQRDMIFLEINTFVGKSPLL